MQYILVQYTSFSSQTSAPTVHIHCWKAKGGTCLGCIIYVYVPGVLLQSEGGWVGIYKTKGERPGWYGVGDPYMQSHTIGFHTPAGSTYPLPVILP